MPAGTFVMEQPPTPEGMVGNGFHCPGCGLPFNTIRDPRKPADRVVATGLDIVFVGSLVICEQCAADIATAIGFINPEAGKARASDVRRSQRRDQAIRRCAIARDTAAESALALRDALADLDDAFGEGAPE